MTGETAPTQDDQAELADALSRCATGDRDALRLIFDLEAGRMVSVVQRIVRRRDLAEEVVQDAFVQIWTKATQFSQERGSPRGWIYAIARNRALNLIRDSKRETFSEDDPQAEQEAAAQADDADAVLAALDARSQLRNCLSELDERRRRSIVMAYVYGFTHGEIAGKLAIPLGTAKAWIRRGLAALRDCLS